jgi:two-component system, OmpR family, response regulator MprA
MKGVIENQEKELGKHMEKAHILIVDDSKTRRALLLRDFRSAEYKVSLASDGMEAIQEITRSWPDLVLIDYDMPKLTGIDVIEWIRKKGLDVPVILMTVHNSDELHAKSLKLGSDDYLQLPVAFNVMLAHVEARLKRHTASANISEKMRFADVEVNMRNHTVHRGSNLLELTATEYRLFVLFLKHPLHVLSRDQIIECVWGHNFEGLTQIVDSYVRNLRKKLEAYGGKRLIHTVHGVGYVLREPQDE